MTKEKSMNKSKQYIQYKNDFTESNRWKHFLLAVPIGLVFTVLCVLGVASGMEFKDKQWGGRWDWLDWLYTIFGGLIGQILQVLSIYLIVN
jgi:uncharacterized membrane protein